MVRPGEHLDRVVMVLRGKLYAGMYALPIYGYLNIADVATKGKLQIQKTEDLISQQICHHLRQFLWQSYQITACS